MRNLILALILMFAGAAQASSLTWTVDATFYDGGTLTGTFDFDADTSTYSNINLTASAGSGDFGDSWLETTFADVNTDWNSGGSEGAVSFLGSDGVGTPLEWSVILTFQSALTAAGGLVTMEPGFEYATTGSAMGRAGFLNMPDNQSTDFRHIVAGSVTAVPIPAAAWLFASGLGLLGWRRRR